MTKEDYQNLLPSLPASPGVYRFVDAQDEILYIGKAKSLKNRIASYFTQGKDQRNKTRIMVRAAARIEYTLVDTEQDALLLEASLIKKHQPRYNVALKSDRPYPYICIKKERFPRVFVTRQVVKDGSRYFGPYTARRRIEGLLQLIKNLFQLRTCTFQLSQESIDKGKFKVCLEYHIKNCKAPCVGFETEEEYNVKVEQIANILKGNFASVKRYLEGEMQRHAENMEFERAHEIKLQWQALVDYQGKSTVVNPNLADADVFFLDQDEDTAYVNYLKVVNGAIINTFMLEMEKNLSDDPPALLLYAVSTLREKFGSLAPEIIVPLDIAPPEPGVKVTVPQIGDKRKLLELAEKNARYFVLQKQKERAGREKRQTATERLLEQMKKDLHMDVYPVHIDCFDNSNLQGTNPVSACVVFKNLKPAKRDYRHYHVKTVEGPDDFATMREVVFRRYRRLLDEQKPLPQLIVIDGGKGQLSAAAESLKALDLYGKVALIGIAKRLEEIYFPEDSVPLLLSKKSPSLQIIQQARDEAHRFALEFHRDTRSKNLLQTELTGIKGIGEKTAQKLLTAFGSVQKIRQAGYEAWVKEAGKAVAERLKTHWEGGNTEEEQIPPGI